jgi:pyruvate/2-oxoglutarate dehydrogenase complex dihydrolipoamide acyltransferase (E2) component
MLLFVLKTFFFALFLNSIDLCLCCHGLIVSLRAQLNEGAKDYKLSVNDFVIKAAAHTLALHPVVNSEWKGTRDVRLL